MKDKVLKNMKMAILDQEPEPTTSTVFLLGKVADRAAAIKEQTVDFVLLEDKKLDSAEVSEYVDTHFDELFEEAAQAAYEDLLAYAEEDEDC